MKYDAIIVGGGHNGLTCAAYLGRAGMRVLVLEAREHVGGMAELASTVGRLSPAVVRELGLRRHGLRLFAPEVSTFAPQPDGASITLWRDVARTADELAVNPLAGRHDADAYVAADAQLVSLARSLAPILRHAPPDLAATSLGATARSIAGAARFDAQLLRFMPMAIRDLVESWFESDALRAAIAARGVLYSALGPRAPGTSGVLLAEAAGSDRGLAGHAVFARGGPRAVTNALAAATREQGGEIRTAARVAQVRRHGMATSGVTLASGAEIDAPVVVSALDPQTTLLDLLEPEVLGPRLSWRASNIRQAGATGHVSYSLHAPPVFPATGADKRRLRGRILIAPSMRYLELAARPARHGASAEQPLLEMMLPTDNVLNVIAQVVAHDADATEIGNRVTKTIEQYAPGFTELIAERAVLTPRDIEREYGARGGHPMHAEIALDQWLEWRPLHGYGRYRMPLAGMYLCSSGAHPGGGVTGLPGRLAAQEIVGDLKRARLKVPA